jgi:vacuolar-type H+-ATPase subunit H
MEKLEQLRKAEQKANNAFMYAKPDQNLQELYSAQEIARKVLRKYEQEYHKGSGVLGNEITL